MDDSMAFTEAPAHRRQSASLDSHGVDLLSAREASQASSREAVVDIVSETEHSGGTEDEDPEKDQKYLAETPLKELTTQLTLEDGFSEKVASAEDQEQETQVCSVCLEELAVGQLVTTLPCKHTFHHDCILRWFSTKISNFQVGCCPSCNLRVVAPAIPAPPVVPVPAPEALPAGTGGRSHLVSTAQFFAGIPTPGTLPRTPSSHGSSFSPSWQQGQSEDEHAQRSANCGCIPPARRRLLLFSIAIFITLLVVAAIVVVILTRSGSSDVDVPDRGDAPRTAAGTEVAEEDKGLLGKPW